jgi:integrase
MPRRSTVRLSDQLVRKLAVPAKGAVITYDAETPGFGIRVTAQGRRSFVLNYVVAGCERRMTIGEFPAWSTTAARDEAALHRQEVRKGTDPITEREAQKAATLAELSAPTMNDLFARYDAEHLPHKAARAAADDRSMWQKLILPQLGSKKVSEIRPSDVDALHTRISKTTPVRANRTIEVLRKAFNLAIRWEMRADNPASGVRRNPEEKRARYLSPDEILKLSQALSAHPEKTSVNAIRLLMLTGARRNEVLRARWDMFNLDNGVWVKPSAHTKQRKEHRLPLSAPAVQLLAGILADAKTAAAERKSSLGAYVFPGRDGKPITDVKRTWLSVCKSAGLAQKTEKRTRDGHTVKTAKGKPVFVWQPDVRLHDLRHTYASILASYGLSLPIIGALLGHTQAQTTTRYAHLYDDPLRAATERVAAVVTSKGHAEVVPLRQPGHG